MAHGLTKSMSDEDQLVPLINEITANLGRKPKEASADAGYCSEANLAALADRNVNGTWQQDEPNAPPGANQNVRGPLTKPCETS